MTFNVTEVEATQTLIYTPEDYLEYCEQQGEEPTESGFLAYLEPEINEDFGGYHGAVTVRYHSN